MSENSNYISPKKLFLQDCLANGIDAEDAAFLADLEFDEAGDVKPGSIYDCYRKKQ